MLRPEAHEPLIEAIDLYCGAGGLTCGLQQGKISVVAGVDLDPSCRFAFEENNASTFHEKDVKELDGLWVKKQFTPGAISLLAGCAPCQPFSTYSNGKDATSNPKWGLLSHFGRLISEALPDLVTMENVPLLANHHPFETFVKTLIENKYWFDWRVVDCADYGVPQRRRRLVLLASRLGLISVPAPTHEGPSKWISVEQAIGRLSQLKAGTRENAQDPLHIAPSLSELNMKRIRASRPGGNWMDWPDGLRAECHNKASGSTYKSVYGRMLWSSPSPTMTTLCFGFGNGRFGHPEQDRAISLREAATFQSFPDTYQFCPKGATPAFHGVGKLIGNAVPPGLGKAIADQFKAHVKIALGKDQQDAA